MHNLKLTTKHGYKKQKVSLQVIDSFYSSLCYSSLTAKHIIVFRFIPLSISKGRGDQMYLKWCFVELKTNVI